MNELAGVIFTNLLWLLVFVGWVLLIVAGLEADKPLSGGVPGHLDIHESRNVHPWRPGDKLGEIGGWVVFGAVCALLPVVSYWDFCGAWDVGTRDQRPETGGWRRGGASRNALPMRHGAGRGDHGARKSTGGNLGARRDRHYSAPGNRAAAAPGRGATQPTGHRSCGRVRTPTTCARTGSSQPSAVGSVGRFLQQCHQQVEPRPGVRSCPAATQAQPSAVRSAACRARSRRMTSWSPGSRRSCPLLNSSRSCSTRSSRAPNASPRAWRFGLAHREVLWQRAPEIRLHRAAGLGFKELVSACRPPRLAAKISRSAPRTGSKAGSARQNWWRCIAISTPNASHSARCNCWLSGGAGRSLAFAAASTVAMSAIRAGCGSLPAHRDSSLLDDDNSRRYRTATAGTGSHRHRQPRQRAVARRAPGNLRGTRSSSPAMSTWMSSRTITARSRSEQAFQLSLASDPKTSRASTRALPSIQRLTQRP